MKIPSDRKPYEVIINGVKKVYEAGASVADDADVQCILDGAESFPPEAAPVPPPFPIPEQQGGGGVVTAKVTYSSGSYTADVSYADLRAAYEAGSEIQLEYSNTIYKLSIAGSNTLTFANNNVVNGAYVEGQKFEYSSSSLVFVGAEVSAPSAPMTYSATLDGGTYTLDSDAGSISSNFNSSIPCYIYLTDGDEVNYTCPIVGAKETPGDDDSSYAFYIVVNGSIVAFTAASGSDSPTYTPAS